MAKESFLLVSLKEDKAKELAQTLTNDSCRKILDFLANKEASESEIAKELNIPLSTVHYNLQALMKAKLVEVEEFHYSKKGREINHYKLANKFIIIAPKDDATMREKLTKRLKNILPVAGLAVGAAAMIQWLPGLFQKSAINTAESMKATPMMDAADMGARATSETVSYASNLVGENVTAYPPALWFLGGAVFVLIVYIIFTLIRRK